MVKRGSALFFFVFFLAACSKSIEQDKLLLGTWRLEQKSGIHTSIAFHDNGAFEVEVRIEAPTPSIPEKYGKASGTWKLEKEGNQLILDATKGNPEIGWLVRTVSYSIRILEPLKLQLENPDKKITIWHKTQDGETDRLASKISIVKIAPFIANLAPGSTRLDKRYKWICTEIEIALTNFDATASLPPSVYEKIIFFFNATPYSDLNRIEKLDAAAARLKNTLNPLLNNRVKHLSFDNTTLTGRKEIVDDYLTKYAAADNDSEKIKKTLIPTLTDD